MAFTLFRARICFFFFEQKTAYEMRISDWSSDVCSSDLRSRRDGPHPCRSQSGGGDRRMTNELSSPICYGPQADDAYMGYAPRDEILAALKELLEAERAIRGRFSLSRPDAGGQSRRSALVRDALRTDQ